MLTAGGQWLTAKPRRTAVLLGAIAALGQAPVSLPWVTLGAIGACAFLHLATERPIKAAGLGWYFGFGYFAVALHWIVEPFLVDIARHGWMAPFALIFLAGGLALFWAAAAGMSRWLAASSAQLPHRIHAALIWAAMLCIAELGRTYLLTGFPWALIGHVWIGWAPMQLAAWIGPLGLTALTVFGPALLVALWPSRTWVGAGVTAFIAIYGVASVQTLGSDYEDGPVVRLVQPNAPQHLKWHPDYARGFFDRQVDYTAAEAESRPDLIIWPETTVPAMLERTDYALSLMAEAAAGVPVIFGIQRSDVTGSYNALVVLDQDGAIGQIYDKHHLVPFGEYIPAFKLLSAMPFGAFVEEQGFGYAKGPGPRVLDLGEFGAVLPLICYEAVFPHNLNAVPEVPDWILQITNDAWFGNWVGPYQHLAQARLRAVEQGRSLVRVANTGVSAVIDPHGRLLAQLPLNEAGFLDARVPLSMRQTVYRTTGDWPMIVAFLAVLGLCARQRRRIAH